MRLSLFAIALGLGIAFSAPASEAQADGIYRKPVYKVRVHVRKTAYQHCDLVRWNAVLTRDGFRWRRVYACGAWS